MRTRIVALFCAVLAAAWAAEAGIAYTMQVSSDGGGQQGGGPGKMTLKGMIQDDNARIEFQGQPGHGMPAGGYMLIKEGGAKTYMVDTENKMYFSMNTKDAADMAGAMMGMKVSDVSVEKTLDEDGGKILGYHVRHVKIRTSYTMEMNVMGNQMKSSVAQEDEMWVADGIKLPNADEWMKPLKGALGGEFKKIADAQKEHMKGFPLKMVSLHTSTNPMGQTQTTKSTMEVTELAEKDIPAGMFAIPADYREQAMPQMPGPGAGRMPQRQNR